MLAVYSILPTESVLIHVSCAGSVDVPAYVVTLYVRQNARQHLVVEAGQPFIQLIATCTAERHAYHRTG